MNPQRRYLLAAVATATFFTPVLHAAPQAFDNWPTKPIRLVVPNMAGGGMDLLARTMQEKLQEIWGQQILVDYKPGAGTVLGTDVVAKSQPDGYTLGMVATAHVINPSLRKQLPYDTRKDFTPITMTATTAMLLTASLNFQPNTLEEVLAYAKDNPGKLSYATAGAGSAMHLAGELLKQQSGVDMLHVAYKGAGGAVGDVVSGRVNLYIEPLFSSMRLVRDGRLKPIAVLSAKRDESEPDIPAVGEIVPGFDVQSIHGIVGPAGMPPALARKISDGFARALKSDELVSKLNNMGLKPVGSTPDEFDAYVQSAISRWSEVVQKGNIALD